MARHWTKVVVWLGVSALLFAGAALLTEWVTSVNGRPVFGRQGKKPFDTLAPVQNISIFIPPLPADDNPSLQPSDGYGPPEQLPKKTLEQRYEAFVKDVEIKFHSDHEGANPVLEMHFPPGADAKIVVNNLAHGKCTAGQKDLFPGAITTRAYGDWYLISRKDADRLPISEFPFTVVCSLSPIADKHTFTKRVARFSFATSDDPLLFGFAKELYGLTPLAKETISFDGIDGADEFRFDGGYQDQSLSGFESVRTLGPNDHLSLTWSDVNREQLRDLLLVVIGTVIGIAVAMLVEALRIVIDTPRMFAAVPRTFAVISRFLSRLARAAAIEGS